MRASDAVVKRTDTWAKTVARWESEPEAGEGRKELIARAKAVEEKHDTATAKHHHYEVSSAAFQIAIVLASATVITSGPISRVDACASKESKIMRERLEDHLKMVV